MLRLGKLECSGGFLLAAALLFYMDPGDLIHWRRWLRGSMSWATGRRSV